MIRALRSALVLALLATVLPAAGQEDPWGGSGGDFVAGQETGLPLPATAPRCGARVLPLSGVIESVRESTLVAPRPSVADAELDFAAAAAGPVIGSISVCYLVSGDRDRAAYAVLELAKGAERMTVEAAGDCKEIPTPKDPGTFFQTCTMQVTGPAAEGIRSGTLTSGGIVPKAAPASSIRPNVWTLFVVRE
jgi:hypothetical protein